VTPAVATIRRASVLDIERVHDLARELRVEHGPFASSGFLVDTWTVAEFEQFLRMGVRLYVAESHAVLDGFLLLFDADQWRRFRPAWESDVVWQSASRADYFFVDQIAVRRAVARQGVGRALYDHLASVQGMTMVYAEIVSGPMPNTASLLFHQAMGFEIVGTRVESDQVRVVAGRGGL
jgi:predicted GNAT superfamily acetyltransferase